MIYTFLHLPHIPECFVWLPEFRTGGYDIMIFKFLGERELCLGEGGGSQ